MKKYKQNPVLLKGVAVICFALGGATLIPWAYSREPSILGYYALCPFSPISSILLFYSGLMVNGYRNRVI